MTQQPDPEAGESPPAQSIVPHGQPAGHFLKSVDEDTDVDASEVKDQSDGLENPDFMGKSNLENRYE